MTTHRSSSHVDKAVVIVLVVGSVIAQVYMIDPNVGGVFDCDCILVCRGHVLMHCVADNDVGCIHDREANANDFWTSLDFYPCHTHHNLLPLRPMIDLLEPTKIFLAPEMVPETTTMRGSFPATALSRASSVETVTVAPPLPPEVL